LLFVSGRESSDVGSDLCLCILDCAVLRYVSEEDLLLREFEFTAAAIYWQKGGSAKM
jgi:hypothetical protein